MARVTQVREPNLEFDLTTPDNLPEIFADGTSQAMVGLPVSKVVFHSLQPGDGGVEQRKAVMQLVIGTPALVEFCRNVLSVTQQNEQQIVGATEAFNNQIKTLLDGVVIPATLQVNKENK